MARRGNILEGIRAGINSYMQMRSMMGKIRMQELQRQAYRRQMAGYESPEEQREAKFQDWARRQEYVRNRPEEEQPEAVTLSEEQIKAARAQGYVPLQKPDGTWTWRRAYGGAGGSAAGGGAGRLDTMDIKRIQGLVTDMITDLRMDTNMDEIWPIMIPAQVRSKVESLVASGKMGRAKGYLHSNYIFSSPQVKKKIQRLLDTLDTDISYEDVTGVISSAQAGVKPQIKEEKLTKLGKRLRENPELAEMFTQVGDMALKGVPLDNIAPYVENATTALYPEGKEPAGGVANLGRALESTYAASKQLQYKTPFTGAGVSGVGEREGENVLGALKWGAQKIIDAVKESGRSVFEVEQSVPVQAGGAATPKSLEAGAEALNPKDEALNENVKIRMNK